MTGIATRGGKVIPPSAYGEPTWGLAAGDVNGDGAIDMLVGGLNGKLSLLVNETLTDRPKQPDISTINDVRKQMNDRDKAYVDLCARMGTLHVTVTNGGR